MQPDLQEQVASAYEHLYDLVYLRSHPFADLLVREPGLSRRERAWRLHHILLELVDQLDPGPQAPVTSREWRRHRIMVLRYIDGLDPGTVADRVALGRRQYFREQEAALEAIAQILWDSYLEQSAGEAAVSQSACLEAPLARPDLLRSEAARTAGAGPQAGLDEIISGVLAVVEGQLSQRRLTVRRDLPPYLPPVAIERSLLRPLLFGLLGYLMQATDGACIMLSAQILPQEIALSLAVEPAAALAAQAAAPVREQLATVEELAALGGARLVPRGTAAPTGFEVHLPLGTQRTLLVVDDNEDVVDLFRRYLSIQHYQVIGVREAREVLDLAARLQPEAITLDLMMPEQDGWDLLQLLVKSPSTCHIPVIVCSVLPQKQLILALGAAAFLEKPVSAQTLLDTLQALSRPSRETPKGSAPVTREA